MEYIYAAMILHSAEKDINEENVKSIIEAAGIDADDARIKALIAALEYGSSSTCSCTCSS